MALEQHPGATARHFRRLSNGHYWPVTAYQEIFRPDGAMEPIVVAFAKPGCVHDFDVLGRILCSILGVASVELWLEMPPDLVTLLLIYPAFKSCVIQGDCLQTSKQVLHRY